MRANLANLPVTHEQLSQILALRRSARTGRDGCEIGNFKAFIAAEKATETDVDARTLDPRPPTPCEEPEKPPLSRFFTWLLE
jgi:hypothetical protein